MEVHIGADFVWPGGEGGSSSPSPNIWSWGSCRLVTNSLNIITEINMRSIHNCFFAHFCVLECVSLCHKNKKNRERLSLRPGPHWVAYDAPPEAITSYM